MLAGIGWNEWERGGVEHKMNTAILLKLVGCIDKWS